MSDLNNVVICLDDDERTTVIQAFKSEDSADSLYHSLEQKYPNGAFDVVTAEDAHRLPKSEYNW